MGKYWTYTPNEHTTSIAFTVHKKDGGSTAFSYSLGNDGWELDSGSKGNIVAEGGLETVSIYDDADSSITKIECECSNDTVTAEGPTVNVNRLVFLGPDDVKMYDIPNGPKAGRIFGLNETMWHYYIPPEEPITFTELTQEITLPSVPSSFSQFYGFAILDGTAPHVVTKSNNVALSAAESNGLAHWMWYCPKNNRQITSSTGGYAYTDPTVVCGLDYLIDPDTLQTYSYNGTYYMIPLYYESGTNSMYMRDDNGAGHVPLRDFSEIQEELYPGRNTQQSQ